jgi:hypothetical protein
VPDRKFRQDRMRVGQQRALTTILKLFGEKRFVSIVLPTRYGKSDVIRMVAFLLFAEGRIGAALAISPNTLLRDQLIMERKINGMLERYEARFGRDKIPVGLIDRVMANPGVNGEWLLSANIQLIQRNLDIFAQWVESVRYRTGLPVIVYIDEAHTGSTRNKWGEVAQKLAAAGATIVLLTATPYRADGDHIHGFECDLVEESTVRKYITRDDKHTGLRKVDVYEGSKRLYKLRADYEYTLGEAWNEDPLPVAKISWLPFAVDIEEIKSESNATAHIGTLAEMSTSAVRQILGRVTRDPRTVQCGVTKMVDELRQLKSRDPKIMAIVFCGNDKPDDPDFNAHAKLVREYCKQIEPSFRVLIATSANGEEDDEDGQAQIEAARNGACDILIVKQMASVGLDIEELKVALDLSPVRSAAAFLQRLMRIATVYKNFVGTYIAPDEPIGKALFERFVVDEGGEASVLDLTKIDTIDAKGKPESKPFYVVGGTGNADFGDSDQIWANKELLGKVEWFRNTFPEVVGSLSQAAIAARIEKIDFKIEEPAPNSPQTSNTNVLIFTLRKRIGDNIKMITGMDRQQRGLTKESPEKFGETIRAKWAELYKRAGINGTFVPLDMQNDLAVLDLLDAASNLMLSLMSKGEAEVVDED